MAQSSASASLNLGFLTVLHEPSGHLGGYLVTNVWGRPLEFRLSTAVQPNRVQQVLYGPTLEAYICADLIGKTLVDKTGTAVQLVVTDTETVLDLRQRLDVPVVWLAAKDNAAAQAMSMQGAEVKATARGQPVLRHLRFAEDAPLVREMLERLDNGVDLAEPFARIREAIVEARRMGVASRN